MLRYLDDATGNLTDIAHTHYRQDDHYAIHCAIFDVRQESSILAICIPSQQTVYLYRLSRAAKDAEEPGKLQCTPISQLDGVSISAVYATRKDIQDLAIVTSDGGLSLISADAVDFPIVSNQAHPYAGIRAVHGSIVHLIVKNSQKIVSVDLSCWTKHATVQEALDALAYILPCKTFSGIYADFLRNSQANTDTSEEAELNALRRTLVPAVDTSNSQESLSDWELLISGKLPSPRVNSSSTQYDSKVLQACLMVLHLLKEEWSLLSRKEYAVAMIVNLLGDLAAHLGMSDYLEASIRDGGTSQLGKSLEPFTFENSKPDNEASNQSLRLHKIVIYLQLTTYGMV